VRCLSLLLNVPPNAGAQPRPKAGAERTLKGVGCSGVLGAARHARHRLSVEYGHDLDCLSQDDTAPAEKAA